MSTEFGIFNDEGLIEGGFVTVEDAQRQANVVYPEDEVHVGEVCEHENEREYCKTCEWGDEEPEPEVAARREFLRLSGKED